jgi:hypothetical protein
MLRHGIARHSIKQFKNHKTNVIPISEGESNSSTIGKSKFESMHSHSHKHS